MFSLIKSIKCDKSSFKQVIFKEGFNIIVADKTSESTSKDSRNGVGKSTLIEILDFCLGSDMTEGLKAEQLYNWTFFLEIDLNEESYIISRNTKISKYVYIEKGNVENWPLKPKKDLLLNKKFYSISQWRKLMGDQLFNLKIVDKKKKYKPSYRSLISYFIRKGKDAYLNPFQHSKMQQKWDIQVNNAYLLGLNFEFPAKLQLIKEKKKLLKSLKTASKTEFFDNIMGSIGELEAEKIKVENKIRIIENQIRSYKVYPQYYNIQEEANEISEKICKLNDEYTINFNLLTQYQNSIKEEEYTPTYDIKEVYSKIGLIFPQSVKKRLEDVEKFHTSIIRDRKEYLLTEIERLNNIINSTKEQIEKFSNERAEKMKILTTHGALNEFSKIQENLVNKKSFLNEIKQKVENLKKVEKGSSEIKIEKEILLQDARRDFNHRKDPLKDAILKFNKNSEFLYSEPGTLSIDIDKNGYSFKVDIKRDGSEGIDSMKIFCYDLTFLEIRNPKPFFLIHDSILFDNVDERQIAKAFELASNICKNIKAQYICTMNSDRIPYHEFNPDFKEEFEDCIILKLTDDKEDGGLLGIRY